MALSKFFLVLAIVTATSSFVFSQGDETVKIDTSIVRLNVGVVDGRGHPITDLNKSSFNVYEDGVKQEISRFEPSTAPFSVVMVLDMSGSTLPMRQVMKMSAFRFLDALSPDDRVAVVEFYDKINLRNDFTTNRNVAAHSIDASNGQGKTQFFKALDFSLGKLSYEGNRRKAIIVLSDGVDTSEQDADRNVLSKVSDDKVPTAINPENSDALNKILRKADLMGVTIYPLALPTGDPAKLADPTPRQIAMYNAARARLKLVADRTGGTMHAINHLEEMGTLYALVAADLRTLYTIEYQPQNDKRDGKWREISVKTDDPNLISRTRPGYFAR